MGLIHSKRLLLALTVGVVAVLAAACGGAPTAKPCDETTCSTGCCDTAGTCQLGTQPASCGTAGAACSACLQGQSCLSNVCTTPGTGGGAGGGMGGGAGGGGGGPDAGVDGGTDAGSGGPLSGDAGVDAFVAACAAGQAAFCDYLERCGFASTLSGMCEDAIARGNLAIGPCADPGLQAAIQVGTVDVDTSALQSCIGALSAAACDHATLGGAGPFATVCKNALIAKSSSGGPCTLGSNVECASGTFCDTANAMSCPAQCAARLADGADAGDGTINPCVTGFYPYDADADGTYNCTQEVDAGISCAAAPMAFNDQTCAPDAYCDSTTQLCTPLLGLNSPDCLSDADCQAPYVCTDNGCKAALPGTNAACDLTSPFGCKLGLYCEVGATADRCQTPKALNGACGGASNASDDCLFSTFCNGTVNGSTCVAKLAAGGLCPAGTECDSSTWCDFFATPATCVQRGGEGATCGGNEECAAGLICDSAAKCARPSQCP